MYKTLFIELFFVAELVSLAARAGQGSPARPNEGREDKPFCIAASQNGGHCSDIDQRKPNETKNAMVMKHFQYQTGRRSAAENM